MARLLTSDSLMAWSALAAFVICTAIGYIVQKVIELYLARTEGKGRPPLEAVVLRAVRRPLVVWLALLGLYIAGEIMLTGEAEVLYGRVVLAVFLAYFTQFSARLVGNITNAEAAAGAWNIPVTSLTRHVARALVYILGAFVLLGAFHVSITPFLAALGVGSLALALGLQDTLNNVFAGIYVLISRHVRPGHYIRLDTGQEGEIVDIGWRATRLRSLGNDMIIVPNAKLSQAIITNFDLPQEQTSVAVAFSVTFNADLAQVERAALEIGQEVVASVEGAAAEVPPVVRFQSFADLGVQGVLIVRSATFEARGLIIHECVKRLHERFGCEGIEFAQYPKPGAVPMRARESRAPAARDPGAKMF